MVASYITEIGADLPSPADRVAGRTLGIEYIFAFFNGVGRGGCMRREQEG